MSILENIECFVKTKLIPATQKYVESEKLDIEQDDKIDAFEYLDTLNDHFMHLFRQKIKISQHNDDPKLKDELLLWFNLTKDIFIDPYTLANKIISNIYNLYDFPKL